MDDIIIQFRHDGWFCILVSSDGQVAIIYAVVRVLFIIEVSLDMMNK